MDPSLLKAYEREFPRQLSDFTDLDMGSYENDTDEKRSGYLRAQDYWPNNGKCIPYWIDERFGTTERQIIKAAVRSMEQQTHFCLSFKLRRNESEYISFRPGRRCAADVGRISGKATRILLRLSCIHSGILLHEMMHALGFFHEHTRPDRDKFVHVYWEHVPPDALSYYNITPLMATYKLPYDYHSILHASAFEFAQNSTQPAILPKSRIDGYFGNRDRLSTFDAVKVQRAYGCTDYRDPPVSRSLLPAGCGVDAHVDTPAERSKANSSYQSSELLELSNYNASETSNVNETSLHTVSGTTDQSSQHWLWILSPAGILPAVFLIAAFRRRRICTAKQGVLDQLELRCEAHLPDEKPTVPMRNRSLCGNRSSPFNTNGDAKDEEWEFPRDQIKRVELVGEGCFGQVYKAEAKEPSGSAIVVAVKILKETVSSQETDEFLAELHIMKSLQPHTNVVRLLGCCTDQDPVYLIMEFVSVGKLQTYLRRNRSSDYYGIVSDKCSSHLTAARLISFALQIASGMLHLSASGILHRDLAARNILLTEDLVCKVSDFGLARDVCESHVYQNKSENRLPIRWMAPESLADSIFTVHSDVWSFGILVWEIITIGCTPYPGMGAGEVVRQIKTGYRMEKPIHCSRTLFNLMASCWATEPTMRPSFAEIAANLDEMALVDKDYLVMNQVSENVYYYEIFGADRSDEKV